MRWSLLEAKSLGYASLGRKATRARVLRAIVILAPVLLLRIGFLLEPPVPLREKVLLSVPDAPEYERLTQNLLAHGVFSQDSIPPLRPELFRTPVYPLCLTPFYALDRHPFLWIVLAQTLLSLALAGFTYRLACDLGRSRAEAAAAALLTGTSPNLAFLATKEVTETLFTTVLVAILWMLVRARRGRQRTERGAGGSGTPGGPEVLTADGGGWAALAGAGIGCGLLMLIRPIAALWPACLGAWLLTAGTRRRRARLRDALILLACAALTAAPWILRNGESTGRYILSTAGERNLYLYNAATTVASREGISLADARNEIRRQALSEAGGAEAPDEAHFWHGRARIGLRYVLRHPLAAARVHLLGFAADFASPISLRPLLIHCGVGLDIDEGGNRVVMQETNARLAGGRLRQAWEHLRDERLRRLPPFGRAVLVLASVFEIALLGLVLAGFRRARGARWLWIPVLYFTLLTGPVGDARFRAPVEPLLAILASPALAALVTRRRFPGSSLSSAPR